MEKKPGCGCLPVTILGCLIVVAGVKVSMNAFTAGPHEYGVIHNPANDFAMLVGGLVGVAGIALMAILGKSK